MRDEMIVIDNSRCTKEFTQAKYYAIAVMQRMNPQENRIRSEAFDKCGFSDGRKSISHYL